MALQSRREFGKAAAKLATALCVSETFAGKIITAIAHAQTGSNTPGNAEAWNYSKLPNSVTRCNVCPRGCTLSVGEFSYCRAKRNINGVLVSLSYGKMSTINFDPVEKSPLFHFTPGKKGLAIGPSGCNLNCLYCQNWQISQKSPLYTKNTPLLPDKGVRSAKEKNLSAMIFTYTEPVTYPRYLMEMTKMAKVEGLMTNVVTAGYVYEECIDKISENVDAFTVGLKGWDPEFYRQMTKGEIEPVKKAIKKIARSDKWLEIVTLLVPTKNDDDKTVRNIAKFVKNETGVDTPLHFLRFTPAYKLRNLPNTPVSVMERARKIAMDEGLRYVYLGNVPGHIGQNTLCPTCGKTIIRKVGFEIIEEHVNKGYCEFCKTKIPGIWK